jgi:hypothetical protein
VGFALAVVALAVSGGWWAPGPVSAAVIEVDSNLDNEAPNNDLCTLREAIKNANADGDTTQGDCEAGTGEDQITFAAGVTAIVLGSPLPPVTDADGLTIEGAGIVTVSGNNQHRPFRVDMTGSLTLNGLTVTEGLADNEAVQPINGGGILNFGTLVLNDSLVTNNASNANGAGIYSDGEASVGGTNGDVTLNNSTVSNNRAGVDGSGNGGGIYMVDGGTLTLDHSRVTGNLAGVLTDAGFGGGIFQSDSAPVVLINSTISDNEAPDAGGGLRIVGSLTVSGSTISGNDADTDNDGGHQGGAISNQGGTVVLANSTISGNSAASGGGIYNSSDEEGSVTLTNVTVALNTSDPLGSNSGIHNEGLATAVTIQNSLFVNNTVNCSGPVTSLGNNLSSDATCVDGSVTGDLANNANANIGPLQDNGGPTDTHALLDGSDAIDAGDDTACAAPPVNNMDQRGVTRPQDGDGDGTPACDIGAYELESQLVSLTVTKLCVGEGFAATFEITAADVTETAACGDTVTAPDLAPGDYTVSETISGDDAGAFATVIACDGGVPVEDPSVTVTIPADAAVDVTCVIINFFDPDGAVDGDPTALICLVCLDLEIDIDNGNTNTIGIDNDNTNSNANDNDNLNDNDNSNENKNENANQNVQDQDNAQGQDNANEQTNNVTSSPEVNIDFGD